MKKHVRWKRVCALLLLGASATAAPTKRFRTITIFNRADGENPEATLVQATDGNLYGTTAFGGANDAGTVFRITPDGTLITLYSFCAQANCADGNLPTGALIQATDGSLYGTTQGGGSCCSGTVFKVSLDGTLTTLHNFGGNDGLWPVAGLVQASDGNFYGTTGSGGSLNCQPSGCGTIFEITPTGVLTTLYSFCSQVGCADGGNPYGGLVQNVVTGDLYGTTYFYGALGGGTVFKFSHNGGLTTIHNFSGPDGMNPFSALVQATNGDFYGTTFVGGNSSCYGGSGCGTVFKITPAGGFDTLHFFDGLDGAQPKGTLMQATDGLLYGTTSYGGSNANDGSVFRINFVGELTSLLGFPGGYEGLAPVGGLVQASNGNLYGTTVAGGTYGDGNVFGLIGLNPFVKMLPNSGSVGTQVEILGTALTGATGVTFKGVSAQFTVESPSLIVATVPVGARTGPITVTLPEQKLSSKFPFYVSR